jgi:sugar lactone lactonase YvrE
MIPLFMLLLLLTACTQNPSSNSAQVASTTPVAFSLRCPHQVALDKQGNIYLSEGAIHSGDVRIVKLSSTGQVLASWHPLKPGINDFRGIVLSNVTFDTQGNLYFTETAGNSIMKYSPQGTFLAQLGTSQQTSDPLHIPLGMVINTQENLYVSDNGYIRTISPDGKTLAAWNENENNDIGSPVNLMTLDAQGNLYVLDHHYVVKFSPSGKRLQVWSEYPTAPVSLDPAGITIAASGTVYVADGKNHRVLRLSSNGTLQSVWDTSKEPKQTFVESVVVDRQGNFYVIDGPNPRQVEKISPQGSILSTWKANCPDDAP